ncbi:MAG: glycosyltransferase family 2 protein [Patescibacteria group bacterium]
MLKTVFLIVTPSYNQAEYIQQTIESVVSQDEQFEYWVLDGGSTDRSVQILESYATQLRWQSKKDNGQTDAINQGIKKLRRQVQTRQDTQYIFAYLNSDDYYLRHTFRRVAQAFRKHPEKSWLVGDCLIVDEKSRVIQQLVRWYKRFWRRCYSAHILQILNPIPQPATFIRWEAVEEIGLFNEKLEYVMDYEYWHRLQQRFGDPMLIADTLAAFRIHSSSKGGTQFQKQFAEELEVAQTFSKNSVLIILHRIHNLLIAGIYRMIK